MADREAVIDKLVYTATNPVQDHCLPGSEPRPRPPGDPWRGRFRPLEWLSAYAPTFRYSLTPTPKIDDLLRMVTLLLELHATARAELLAT